MLATARPYLHCDNSSCRKLSRQPALASPPRDSISPARNPVQHRVLAAPIGPYVIPFVDEEEFRVPGPGSWQRQAERRAAGTVNPVAGTTSVLAAGGGHADAVVT